MTEKKVEVIQADREAAAQFYLWFLALSSSRDAALKTAQFVRDGGGDGWNSVVAFARHRLTHSSEEVRLREALEPVRHWYQSDEHEDRPLAAIVADLVADLQHDRPLALQAEKLREALNDLVSWLPEKPTDPEWRLQGGKWGADDAVAHARSTLFTMRNNGNG